MNNILTLSNINESDLPKVGQRATDLGQIHKSKFAVPLSFVVPNLLFHEFLLQNKLGIEIKKIMNSPNKSDDDFEDIYAKIKSLFEYAIIPTEFREELFESYETLSLENNTNAQGLLDEEEPIVNLIISPSYTWTSERFTGILLNIQGFDNFLNGLKSCWLSLYSPEHLRLRESKKIDEFSTGIIVQRFVSADCTIDAYSKSLLGNYEIPITAYFGLPDITYKISKDIYSISRETFGIENQEIKVQEHILLRNTKSGTLIKRNLGKRGTIQKILDKHIFEIARLIDRASSTSKKHLRVLIFAQDSKNSIFFVDRIGDRDVEIERAERKQNHKNSSIEQIEPVENKKESLSDILSSPISDDETETFEKKKELELNKNESNTKQAKESEAFAWETTIKSSTNPELKKMSPIKAIILEDKPLETLKEPSEDNSKVIIFDENSPDDFILSSKPDKSNEENKPSPFKRNESFLKEELEIDNLRTKEEKQQTLGPDNEFFMSIILDLEPAIDQEILKKYQDKFNKVPTDLNVALEELDEIKDFPEKEQIFKLKNMKEMLERGETINLDVFLDVTEKLRRVL